MLTLVENLQSRAPKEESVSEERADVQERISSADSLESLVKVSTSVPNFPRKLSFDYNKVEVHLDAFKKADLQFGLDPIASWRDARFEVQATQSGAQTTIINGIELAPTSLPLLGKALGFNAKTYKEVTPDTKLKILRDLSAVSKSENFNAITYQEKDDKGSLHQFIKGFTRTGESRFPNIKEVLEHVHSLPEADLGLFRTYGFKPSDTRQELTLTLDKETTPLSDGTDVLFGLSLDWSDVSTRNMTLSFNMMQPKCLNLALMINRDKKGYFSSSVKSPIGVQALSALLTSAMSDFQSIKARALAEIEALIQRKIYLDEALQITSKFPSALASQVQDALNQAALTDPSGSISEWGLFSIATNLSQKFSGPTRLSMDRTIPTVFGLSSEVYQAKAA